MHTASDCKQDIMQTLAALTWLSGKTKGYEGIRRVIFKIKSKGLRIAQSARGLHVGSGDCRSVSRLLPENVTDPGTFK